MHISQTISATELNRRSGEILKKVAIDGQHVLIERDGYPLAILLPIRDYRKLVGGVDGNLSESEEVGA